MLARFCGGRAGFGMGRGHGFAFSRHLMPELCVARGPLRSRGRREGRALTAPVARLQQKKQAAVATGLAEASRPSLRDGFNGVLRAPWEPGFLAPIAARIVSARLGLSVGRPGPHDFAVRDVAARPATPSRPSHPASRVVTIATRPSHRSGTATMKQIFPKNGNKIFSRRGLDSPGESTLERLAKNQRRTACAAQAVAVAAGPAHHPDLLERRTS